MGWGFESNFEHLLLSLQLVWLWIEMLQSCTSGPEGLKSLGLRCPLLVPPLVHPRPDILLTDVIELAVS